MIENSNVYPIWIASKACSKLYCFRDHSYGFWAPISRDESFYYECKNTVFNGKIAHQCASIFKIKELRAAFYYSHTGQKNTTFLIPKVLRKKEDLTFFSKTKETQFIRLERLPQNPFGKSNPVVAISNLRTCARHTLQEINTWDLNTLQKLETTYSIYNKNLTCRHVRQFFPFPKNITQEKLKLLSLACYEQESKSEVAACSDLYQIKRWCKMYR